MAVWLCLESRIRSHSSPLDKRSQAFFLSLLLLLPVFVSRQLATADLLPSPSSARTQQFAIWSLLALREFSSFCPLPLDNLLVAAACALFVLTNYCHALGSNAAFAVLKHTQYTSAHRRVLFGRRQQRTTCPWRQTISSIFPLTEKSALNGVSCVCQANLIVI